MSSDESSLFKSLTDEDKELFNSYREAINIRLHEVFPDVPVDFYLQPISICQQIGCGTFYTYKVALPDNQTADVAFHLGGRRVQPLVGPPHFEITKNN
ncbi:unnamed protein product [Adineta steineri]|uniref:Uncharacterized protein n=1 Tax=Adineta steineri TaxID=433720 RepID=A0A813MJE5_9BILA|nr:unnamed protein product [Adineta steineri]CAF3513491.1 unnamed protein product [Adineta steineri]